MKLICKNKLNLIFAVIALLSFFQLHAQTFSALSYNIRLDVASDGDNRWDVRKDQVVGLLRYHGADFIGLQEVLHNQLLYLEGKFPDYGRIGVARDDGKEKGEYSCIFYNKASMKLLQEGTFWLAPTTEAPGKGWDAALPRVCTWGIFQLKKSGKKILVMNTHFDHVGKQARLESAKLILAKSEELMNGKKMELVIMGDFNSTPEEAPAQAMLEKMDHARNVSRYAPYGVADTWNAFQFTKKPNRCIDYIFIPKTSQLQVEQYATLTDSYDLKYPSDHLPVIAKFRWK